MDHDTRASWHDQPIPALTAQFRTDVQDGLTSSEAAQRLQHDGPNELRKGKTVSPLAIWSRRMPASSTRRHCVRMRHP